MRPLDEQSHYEILEVPFDATPDEIERAYRMARASFSEDSMALYSVFDPGDRNAILERLDIAYKVLSDGETRSTYDRELQAEEREERSHRDASPSGGPEEATGEAAPAQPSHRGAGRSASVATPLEAFDDMEEDDESGEFDGARLRRARLRRGIEVEQIAQVTKINPNYLACIEADQYEDLPADVYVRGFLTAYARSIGLEPGRVVASYLGRMNDARQQKRPGRLLGRR